MATRVKHAAPECVFSGSPPPGAAYVRVRPPPTGGWAVAHCRSATRSLVRWRCCRAPVSAPGTARCHACAGFACLFSGASPRMRGSLRALALNHPGHPGPGQGPRPPKACAPQCGGMGGAAAVPLAKPNKNTPMRRPVFWPGHWQFLKWTGVRMSLARLLARSLAIFEMARRSPSAVASSAGAGFSSVCAIYSARHCKLWLVIRYYLLLLLRCFGG